MAEKPGGECCDGRDLGGKTILRVEEEQLQYFVSIYIIIVST